VTDLKPGPLPKHRAVRVPVVLSETLEEELAAYAAEHSRLDEPVETVALIPHMLEAFLRADRAWCAVESRGAKTNRSTSSPSNQQRKHERPNESGPLKASTSHKPYSRM
jgi:hypothetical protein